MPTIFVTRHGQSMTNIDADLLRREQGHAVKLNTVNNILTERGIEEAMTYARALKAQDVHVDHIVCSPFGRTKQTAFTIASVLANLTPITYNKAFQEIAWDVGGAFDRLENYIPDFDSKKLAYDEKPLIDHRRGAITLESQLDVYNRVVPALVRLAKSAKRRKDENTVLVSHFFVVRAIMAFMEHGDPRKMLDYSPKNLCMLSYDVDDILAQAKKFA